MILYINDDMKLTKSEFEKIPKKVIKHCSSILNKNTVFFYITEEGFKVSGQKCCLPESNMNDVLNVLHELFELRDDYTFTYYPYEGEVYFYLNKKQ